MATMDRNDHIKRIKEIARASGCYRPEAFLFVSQAIAHTVKWIKDGSIEPDPDAGEKRGESKKEFHVSGRELIRGLHRLARERWGNMAPHVLRSWGLKSTEDIGEVVFLMVEDEELQWNKRECDTREDFAGGFDFDTAFEVLNDEG